MVGHNIYFKGVMRKFFPKLSLLPLLIWSTGHAYNADVKIKFLRRDYVSFTNAKHITSIYLQFYHSLWRCLSFKTMHNYLKYNGVTSCVSFQEAVVIPAQ